MGLIDTKAIVLRTYNLAEADKIVVLLTRDGGVVRAVARGAKRLRSKFGAGLEPLTLIALSYYEREGRELVTLQRAEILRSLFRMSGNTQALTELAYMTQLILDFAPPNEPNERLFRMMRACIEALEDPTHELQLVVTYFEVWMLKLAGFFPSIEGCADCGASLLGSETAYLNSESQTRCVHCSRQIGTPLTTDIRAYLAAAQRLSPSRFAEELETSSRATRTEIAALTRSLIVRALERVPGHSARYSS
jgi:DNA repair protein RecO (recombination protein O)